MPGQVSQAVERAEGQKSHAIVLRDSIEAMGPEFKRALPAHVDEARFVRAALTALSTVPKLNECTTRSVMAGLMQAAQLGLEISDVRQQAFLIPRKNNRADTMEATFQLGYRGMIDIAARGGITISVDEIHANDYYEFERGTNARLVHKPTWDDPGEVLAYYAVANFADGRRPEFAIMSKAAVEKHRDRFASTKGEHTPWVEHFDAMGRKTVIRKLLNYLPATVELRQAMAIDVQESPPATLLAGIVPSLGTPDETLLDDDEPDAIDATATDGDTDPEPLDGALPLGDQ